MSSPPPEAKPRTPPGRPAPEESAGAPLDAPEPEKEAGGSDEDASQLTEPQAQAVRRILLGPAWVQSWPLIVLAVLALGFTIHVARVVLLPVAVAVLLQFVLGPPVRALRKIGLPASAAAALVLTGAAAFVAGTVSVAWEPAAEWVETLPRSLPSIERKLEALREPVERVTAASRTVDELASLDGGDDEDEPRAVVAEPGPGIGRTVWDQARGFAVHSLLACALLFFLLAAQDSFLTKLVSVLPRLRDKKTAVEVMRSIEREISRYLMTITAINVALGVAVALALWALDMPNPVLWGAMAGLLNFVPYLGTSVGIALVAIVGLLTIDGTWRALAPALAYFLLSGVEGLLVTPLFLGRSFRLSPVMLFIWLLTWSWLWGIPGAILAVPALVMVVIVMEQVPALRPISVFLKE